MADLSREEQVQALIARVQALGFRMGELMDARTAPQAALLVREPLPDLHSWRLGVQRALRSFSKQPTGTLAATSVTQLREALTEKLVQLEPCIEDTMNTVTEGEISADDESFYRLLGAYRAISDAVVDYADIAQGIDWEPWYDSRF